MLESAKNFIAKIQNSGENVRRRWLILSAGVSMAAVIGLWVIYVNAITEPMAATAVQQAAAMAPTAKPGLAQIFAAGLNIVADQVQKTASRSIDYLKNMLNRRTIISVSTTEDFTADNLPEIPLTHLP